MDNESVFALIRATLWGEKPLTKNIKWEEMLNELNRHSIAGLVAEFVKTLGIPDSVRKRWCKLFYAQLCHCVILQEEEKALLNICLLVGLRVSVLKGTSVACYYPHPEYRAMGDIDILVHPEDYKRAILIIEKSGWISIKGSDERHDCFQRNGITVELHRRYSSYTNMHKADELDSILYNAILPNRTRLPDPENGLVIIEHIAQHLEGGIGLRQIIDWMMYVKHCLNDNNWETTFRAYANRVDMVVLAKTVTRMCQLYLGLPTEGISWCMDADETLCRELMEYVMSSGNFGQSRNLMESSAVTQLPTLNHPIKLLHYFQTHGEYNWQEIKQHPWLKNIAWIYQCIRYLKMALNNHIDIKKLCGIRREAIRRRTMFQKLGLTRR